MPPLRYFLPPLTKNPGYVAGAVVTCVVVTCAIVHGHDQFEMVALCIFGDPRLGPPSYDNLSKKMKSIN